MRPIQRGESPYLTDFDNYEEAKPHLVARMGLYCSYCERRIPTMLAVEHIQPKALPAYTHLVGRWDNFLLACVNCNSCKKQTNIALAAVLLPDRDNTFAAFCYLADGSVIPATHLSAATRKMAATTLSATGLDKRICATPDENGKQVALDRVSQRMEAWAEAEVSRADILANPGNDAVRQSAVRLATAKGHFSIWMAVFAADIEMRNRLIDAFAGTRGSGCFDPITTQSVSPAPNPDQLSHGGKI
jgi:uncharacterized protein (TIGR02646 family)